MIYQRKNLYDRDGLTKVHDAAKVRWAPFAVDNTPGMKHYTFPELTWKEIDSREKPEFRSKEDNNTKDMDNEIQPITDYNELFDCPSPPKWLRQNGECHHKRNILFLKTRRTGSSTVQNLMFRHGEKHNLNFVLPLEGNQFGGPSGLPFQKSQIMKTNLTRDDYNILCHQARFNEIGFSSIMPKDSVYITIIRDPITQFESFFTQMQIEKLFRIPGKDDKPSFKTFLEKPETYYNIQPVNIRMWSRNPMLFDLGITYQDTMLLRQINKYVEFLDSKFDFVMLTEFFDESLILLKKFLCLDIEDITYFPHSVRSATSHYVDTAAEGLDSSVLRWNLGDTRLYQHFREKILCLINQYGKRKMRNEVMKLRDINEKLYEFCIAEIEHDSTNVWSPSNVRAIGYKLKTGLEKNPRCVNMIKSEHRYTGEFRNKYSQM
ncbi:galactosylceramide sulfotransferase-like [Glandiceps talaboti]